MSPYSHTATEEIAIATGLPSQGHPTLEGTLFLRFFFTQTDDGRATPPQGPTLELDHIESAWRPEHGKEFTNYNLRPQDLYRILGPQQTHKLINRARDYSEKMEI